MGQCLNHKRPLRPMRTDGADTARPQFVRTQGYMDCRHGSAVLKRDADRVPEPHHKVGNELSFVRAPL